MKKKKVLIVYSIPTPYRLPMFELLAKQKGIDLTVFFMGKTAGNRIWNLNIDNLKYKYLPGWTWNLKQGGDMFPIFINPTIIFEIIKGNYNVVICTGWDSLTTFLARIACLIKGIPFILWAGSTKNEPSVRRSLMNVFVKLLVRSCQAWIAYGSLAKEYLISLGAMEDNIIISYNTVDIDLYSKTAQNLKKKKVFLKKSLGISTKDVVLYVGQLIQRKGVLTLYKAVRKIKNRRDIGIVWVGYGSAVDQLKKLAKSNKYPQQYFFRTNTPEETCKLYAVADLFVLPSDEEVWGLVINEAMASGLPIITTDKVGAAADLVEEGKNGYVIKAGDYQTLAEKISQITDNQELASRMSTSSLIKIKPISYYQNILAFIQAVSTAVTS